MDPSACAEQNVDGRQFGLDPSNRLPSNRHSAAEPLNSGNAPHLQALPVGGDAQGYSRRCQLDFTSRDSLMQRPTLARFDLDSCARPRSQEHHRKTTIAARLEFCQNRSMKRRLPQLLSVSVLAFALSACSPMRFSQYSGSGKSWPVVQESIAETSFSLPVYRSWPDKPYEIIGSVRFEDPNQDWDDGVIGDAVAAAKKRHGNAIIIRHGSEFGVGGRVGTAEDSSVWSNNQVTALVIRWRTREALEAEAVALERFKEQFRSTYASLAQNDSLFESAIDYLHWQGIKLESEGAADKLSQILSEIQSSKEGELNGKWLYRCNVRLSRLTSSTTDALYGMGLVTLKDGVLTIVSTQGQGEVTFSGTYDKGRLTGKMGIGSNSINCDGVGSQEKISVSGQGQVADGIIQANLVFLR